MDNGMNGQGINQAPQGQVVPYAGPTAGPGTGSGNLFHVLGRSWWMLVVFSALGVGGALLYIEKVAPGPTYRSTARLLVEKPSSDRGNELGVFELGVASGNFHQTQATVIASRQIVGLAMRDPNLQTVSGGVGGERAEDLVTSFSSHVEDGTGIISVSATSVQAEVAAKFVTAVVGAYRRWHEQNRQLGAADTLRELNKQLSDYRGELERKRHSLRRAEERRDATAGGGVDLVSEKLDMLKQRWLSARIAAEESQVYYEGLKRYEAKPEDYRRYAMANRPAHAIWADDHERVRLADELRATRANLEAVQAGHVVARDAITRLQSRVEKLEKDLEEHDKDFVANHLSLAKVRADEQASQATQLAQAYAQEKQKVQVTSNVEGEYEDLMSECRILEALCNSHVQKIRELEIRMPAGLKIHVLEQAVPATDPSPGQTTRIIGVGLVAGMTIGCGLAFARDVRDQSVRSADEVTAILGVPVLGAIPRIKRGSAFGGGKRQRFSLNSRESEACRAIRTALFFGVPQDEAAALLVTSPGPQEGKTTLVSNLGIAMAHAGQKTLIVDADLRKPMQQRVFAMKDTGKGLTDLLAGTAELDETVRATRVPGLDVLPSGQNVANPSEILNSQALPALLEGLREKYDRVLIDSPPVGLVTDGQILAAVCDLTLVVLRARRSTRQVTQRARDALYTVGARVAGAVVNDVSRKDRQYSHYSGYGYYYRSGPEDREEENRKLPADVGSESGGEAPRPSRA